MNKILLGILTIAASSMSIAQQWPETTIKNVSLTDVKNRFVLGCTRTGLNVREASDHKVVCAKAMNGMKAIATQVAIGNQYSTTPQEVVTFNIAQMNNDVFVSARISVDTQSAMGQVNSVEPFNKKNNATIQKTLDNVSKELSKPSEQTLEIKTSAAPVLN